MVFHDVEGCAMHHVFSTSSLFMYLLQQLKTLLVKVCGEGLCITAVYGLWLVKRLEKGVAMFFPLLFICALLLVKVHIYYVLSALLLASRGEYFLCSCLYAMLLIKGTIFILFFIVCAVACACKGTYIHWYLLVCACCL